MTTVESSDLPALHAVVRGLRKDLDAVVAGLSLPYSNGPIEGTNTKFILWNLTVKGPSGCRAGGPRRSAGVGQAAVGPVVVESVRRGFGYGPAQIAPHLQPLRRREYAQVDDAHQVREHLVVPVVGREDVAREWHVEEMREEAPGIGVRNTRCDAHRPEADRGVRQYQAPGRRAKPPKRTARRRGADVNGPHSTTVREAPPSRRPR